MQIHPIDTSIGPGSGTGRSTSVAAFRTLALRSLPETIPQSPWLSAEAVRTLLAVRKGNRARRACVLVAFDGSLPVELSLKRICNPLSPGLAGSAAKTQYDFGKYLLECASLKSEQHLLSAYGVTIQIEIGEVR